MSDLGNFVWYELMTTDVAAAKVYYDAVVGLDIDAENTMPDGADGDYRMIKRADGGYAGGVLVLDDTMVEEGARPGWLMYVQTPDVDTTTAQVKDAGGAVHLEPHAMPGVGRMAMLADPQGAVFYVMTPEPPADCPDATSDVFSVDRPQHIRWHELITDDPAAAIPLYAQWFGWRQEGGMPMGDMGEYQFLHHGDLTFGAVMPRQPEMPANIWSFYIGVDDIDRAAKAVTDHGGQLLDEIMEIPGGEFSVHTMDPQGAAVGYVGPRK